MHSSLDAIHTISEKDAARLLVTESALGQFTFTNARRVVRYMKPKRIKAGATLIREGEKASNDFIMLILSGDVRVESKASGLSEPIVITVLGEGSLIGEMGLLSGNARSAACIATTELAVAVLSSTAMKKMLSEEPELAAQFLLAVSSRLTQRLFETTTKLKLFVQLNAVLQNEVYLLMDAQEPQKRPLSRGEMPTEPMGLATQPAALTEEFVAERIAQAKAKNQRSPI